MKNDYKVLLYPANGKPFWAYYIYDTLAKARDYAQEIVKGWDEKDPNRKVKSEIYAGEDGSNYFPTLVETYHWKKEANEVRRIDTVDSIVDDFMRYVRKTPPLQNVSITTAYATKLSRRIKEAHKREVDALKERVKQLEEAMRPMAETWNDFYLSEGRVVTGFARLDEGEFCEKLLRLFDTHRKFKHDYKRLIGVEK